MADIKEVLEEIYSKLNKIELLAEYEPQSKGNYYLLRCPNCSKKEAFIYENETYINCNRTNNCGYSKSIWEFVQEKYNLSNQETLLKLAELAGYKLQNTNKDWENNFIQSKKTANILEKSLNLMKDLLWSDKATKLVSYLYKRGYTEEEIKKMELGFFPEFSYLEKHLLESGYSTSEINETGLNTRGMGNSHILAIPYRDPTGNLKGFIVRSLLENDELDKINEKKYKYTRGTEKDTLFNLHNAKRGKELIITEGYLDALIASVKGIKGVVGTGGNVITEKQFENLLKYKFDNFTLALDNDLAGKTGTEKALKMIYKNGNKAFVLELPEDYKDPDEFISKNGIQIFEREIKKAQKGIKWLANYLFEKHNFFESDKDKENATEEALEYAQNIKDPLLAYDYISQSTTILNIPSEFLELKFEEYKEKAFRKNSEKQYKMLVKDAAVLLENDKIEEFDDFVKEKLEVIKKGKSSKILRTYTLEDLEKDLLETPEGLKTGYDSLDKLLLIPQEAITIIAGRPSHGKTTFLLNLFMNMIELYPEKTFLFFSYEETKKQITLKILNILSESLIDPKRNLHLIQDYIKNKKNDNYEIEKGKKKLSDLTKSSRLWIIDEPFYANQLSDQISYFKSKYNLGAVFIDYIQKIKINGKYSTRQLEIQKISETILETAKANSIPILLGAQLGRDKDARNKIRLDNLREAGDIENDANLVIALNNEAMEKAQTAGEKLTERIVNLKLHILKNRNGAVNEEVEMIFDRPVLKIKDSSPFNKKW